jgi:hypothetical protein
MDSLDQIRETANVAINLAADASYVKLTVEEIEEYSNTEITDTLTLGGCVSTRIKSFRDTRIQLGRLAWRASGRKRSNDLIALEMAAIKSQRLKPTEMFGVFRKSL